MTKARSISRLVSDQVTGNVNISGIVTATTFFGEGSGLTGLTAVGFGVTLRDGGVSRGAAQQIDFADHFTVSTISSGIATITIGITTEYIDSKQINNAGVVTTGSAIVGSAVTINSTGINVSGVVTATTFVGSLTGTATNSQGLTGTPNITVGFVTSTNINVSGVSTFAGITTVTGTTLFAKQLNTSGISTINELEVIADITAGTRIDVAGVTTMSIGGLNTPGIVTATSFRGDGSQLTGVGNTANVRTSTLVVSGVSTFNNVAISSATSIFADTNNRLIFGNDLEILSSGGTNYVSTNENPLYLAVRVQDGGPVTEASIGLVNVFPSNDVYYGNNSYVTLGFGTAGDRLQTLGAGVTVTGTTFTNQLNVSGVSTVGIVTGATYYGDASNTVDGKWTLGANGTSDYTFTGIGFTQTTNDPVLYLARGRVYEFVNNSGGSHPFQIRESSGGSAYNAGVTNNGSASGTIRFEVPFSAPNTLYYQCTNHAGMGNTITIYPSI